MTGRDAESEWHRRVRLANVRQELLAPVNAIAGYTEILLDEAARAGLPDAIEDLERIASAAQALRQQIDRLLQLDAVPLDRTPEGLSALQAELRHDLRNPLNAIMGYGEMLLEELASGALQADLERLLIEARRLLGEIDTIVDFSRHAGDAAQPAALDATSAMAADLMRTVQPLAGQEAAHQVGRILVVDDNESNRDLLCRRLSREGHEVEVAASGREALERLGERFDLILLDLMMPDLNGYEVLTRLKADEGWRHIPVIMISGLQEADSAIRCIEAGAEDYLTKPFNPILLKARINACLERRRWRELERHYLARLEAEKQRADLLLHNILPDQIVTRLNSGATVIADRVESATILFCDLVEFTRYTLTLTPARLVERLNRIFTEFDRLTRALGIEKIKTIGDAYMAAAGLPEPRPDHAEVIAELAFGMLDVLDHLNAAEPSPLHARIGIHTGPVIAGIIGVHRFIYDIWGDTVNLASRLEAQGMAGRIQISETTRRALEHRFAFEPRGMIDLKGRGQTEAYLLLRRDR
jgi:adenylate cyclase